MKENSDGRYLEVEFEVISTANQRFFGCTNSAVPLMPDQVSSPGVQGMADGPQSWRTASPRPKPKPGPV